MEKHILLKAYTEKNLGDDLFVKIICERYKNTKFSIFASYKQAEHLQNVLSNLSLVPVLKKNLFSKGMLFLCRDWFTSYYKKLLEKEIHYSFKYIDKKIDGFVSIGGSIFIENRIQKVYRDMELYKFIVHKYPHIFKGIIGANFGPYCSEYFIDEYRGIFQKMDDVCFRDTSSYFLFKNIDQIRVAPDIVFNLPKEIFMDSLKIKKTIGLSLVDPRRTHTIINVKKYINCIIRMVIKLRLDGYELRFFTFCDKEGDYELALKINQNLKTQGLQECHIIRYQGDIDYFLKEYSKVERMICGRFHSVILSILFEQEFLPFFYSQKIMTVLKDIQFKGKSLSIDEYENLEKISLADFSKIESTVTGKLQKEAERQFMILDKFLL